MIKTDGKNLTEGRPGAGTPKLLQGTPGARMLLMGNEAIARGALEAGVRVVAGYPGTPSSEIVERLAEVQQSRDLYVEWSANEKVSLEVAAAGSFAGLRSLCVMKQVGVNVAADFLLHLAACGTRGGMLLVSCEDPGALSSTNEGESRFYAKYMEIPLIEPGDFQEAREMTRWAFELSEQLGGVVMLRSVTRLSHASGDVVLGDLPDGAAPRAVYRCDGPTLDPLTGPVVTLPNTVVGQHARTHARLRQAAEVFETSPFNTYAGPDEPELLIVTSSVCSLYSQEAIHLLGVGDRVGLLKLGTTWPLPARLVESHLARAGAVLVVEEVLPFLEDNLKVVALDCAAGIGVKTFHGKRDGSLPAEGELNPDRVADALERLLGVTRESVPAAYAARAAELAAAGAPPRSLNFCPGCPHRASFWLLNRALKLDNRDGFVCGDIGCYTMAAYPAGYQTVKTVHAMGSGAGLASGFGKLCGFGLDQPVVAVCGDSTFFHAVLPALANAVHNRSEITLVVLDNSGTAMTGFQTHPGLAVGARGEPLPAVDIGAVCRGLGARVHTADPFDAAGSLTTLLAAIEDTGGVNVVILRQACALSPEKKGHREFAVRVEAAACVGQDCGCDRLCTRVFRCPGLSWDAVAGTARIDEALCTGCGFCAGICPAGAIHKGKVTA
ncbi:MAG TPA: thiamine pyrophosphate-dependent enzyme [Deferrisomatales bacterium]|nr:thiamine pyrophosphate-dependent enzyme [Deferrisomatales bacterium]